MRIDLSDRAQRAWAIWTACLLLLAALGYGACALFFRSGPAGGSIPGLIFGSAGYGLMLYAALLSVRKRFTTWRIGRAKTWMLGHVWLGFLSYPLILFHAGLSFGNGLTRGLMWIFSLVVITGVAGAAIQHFMPRMMTGRVGHETIYYQGERVMEQLMQEAQTLLGSVSRAETQYGLLVPASEKTVAKAATTTLVRLTEQSGAQLQSAYKDTIRPYLAQRGAYRHELNDGRAAKAFFEQLRMVMPEQVRPVIDDMEGICQDKRDLDLQSRLHRILRGWLLAHVPLSLVLILLGAIHAVMALRYI